MALPIVIVASGGWPITESTNGIGFPVEIAANGFGIAATIVASGGFPVIGSGPAEPPPEGAPEMQFNVATNSQLLALLEEF